MSHHEAKRIRAGLKPFMHLLLVVACLGLLASCGAGTASGITSNSGTITSTSSEYTSLRRVTPAMITTSAVSPAPHVAGELIVLLNGSNQFQAFQDFCQKNGMTIIEKGSDIVNDYTVEITSTNDADLIAAQTLLEQQSFVSAVSQNLSTTSNSVSIDPAWYDQNESWNLRAIHLPEARDLVVNPGAGITVGVVDSSFITYHEDLTNITDLSPITPPTDPWWCVLMNSCQSNNQSNQTIAGVRGSLTGDDPNHGMHVAGIIGAKASNNLGTVGVAPNVNLLSYDYMAAQDAGTTSKMLHGASKLALSGANIINMSFGISECNDSGCLSSSNKNVKDFTHLSLLTFYSLIQQNKNIIFVQASGNFGLRTHSDNQTPFSADEDGFVASAITYPTTNPAEISMQKIVAEHSLIVGAYAPMGSEFQVTDYSQLPSNGSTNLFNNFLLAPGGTNTNRVYSLFVTGSSDYGYLAGTSMAAPHVTGVVALVMQANPKLSPVEIRDIILQNSDTVSGYPALNAQKAVQAAINAIPTPTVSFTASPASPKVGDVVTFTPTASSSNGAISTYAWSFGDGGSSQSSNGSAVQYNYATAGTYTIQLTVTDSIGKTNVASQQVTVSPVVAPSPSITGMTPATATVGQLQTFTLTGTNLPTTHLNIVFNNCSNIAFVSQSATVHTFTCTPLASGTLSAVVNNPADSSALGTFSVRVSSAAVTGSFSVLASRLQDGGIFTVPQGVSSCSFNATGQWIKGGTSVDANGFVGTPAVVANPYIQWASNTSPIAALVYTINQAYGANAFSLAGSSLNLTVTPASTIEFSMNDDLSDGLFNANGRSGSLSVAYQCQ